METIAISGGLFAFLTFIHFFADWVFQSQFEAVNKTKNSLVRARHCTIYTAFFVPAILLIGLTGWQIPVALLTLWLSHYFIDTYVPVFLWARWFRKIPELQKKNLSIKSEHCSFNKDEKQVFAELWSQPVYPILFIAVDQIFHLTFLWVVVLLALL
jgi:hypothetical protein